MRLQRKVLIGVGGIAVAILSSTSLLPSSFNCPGYQPSFCGLIENVSLIVGGSIVLKNEVESRILPGTQLEIEDENGHKKVAILSRKATSGRPMSKVTKIRIDCSKATVFQGQKICDLKFDGFDSNSACAKGSPCYGEIQGWSIQVGSDGRPDSELLVYK